MAEHTRDHLHEIMREAIGAEATIALMEYLPATGWTDVATKDDIARALAQLEHRVNSRFEITEIRFNEIDHRFDGLRDYIDSRFGALDSRFNEIDGKFREIDGKIDATKSTLRGEIAATRGELQVAMSKQTRTMIIQLWGGIAVVSGLAFTLARVA